MRFITRIIFALWLPTILLANSRPGSELDISEAVAYAISVHPGVEIAKSLVDEAKRARLREISPSSPNVAVEFEGVPDGADVTDFEERRISISQELEFPLHILWNASASNKNVEKTQFQARSRLLDIETEVRSAFLDAWSLQERVDVLTKTADHTKAYADRTSRLADLGEIANLEARSAQVEALIVQNVLEAEKGELKSALSYLQNVCGLKLDSIRLVSPVETIEINNENYQTVPLQTNLEVLSLRSEIDIAKYEKLAAVTGWLPELELSYFQQRIPTEENPDFWGVELGFSIPFWFWLGGRGDVQQTKARERMAESNLSVYYIELQSAWRRSMENLKSARERRQLFEQELVPLAGETVNLAEKSYSIGEADYLEVIAAQQNYLDVRLEYLDAIVELYGQIIELDRLSGKSILSQEN